MLKNRRIAIVIALFLLTTATTLWLAIGPQVMAKTYGMTYRQDNYNYSVEIDDFYNEQTKTWQEQGIIVMVDPQRPKDNPSGFSENYLQATKGRAVEWINSRNVETSLDVMVIFSRPLTLNEANTVLNTASATVFESGVVGYAADGTPFAEYSKENGPLLVKPLAEFSDNTGIVPEGTTAEQLAESLPADVRGYLSVRVWVNSEGLKSLMAHQDVRVIDTTPQAVRDQLAANRTWQDVLITTVAIEMPVWAYDW